jgi:hypothetical protein
MAGADVEGAAAFDGHPEVLQSPEQHCLSFECAHYAYRNQTVSLVPSAASQGWPGYGSTCTWC